MEIDKNKNYIYIIKNGTVETYKSTDKEEFILISNGAEDYKLLPLTSSIHIQNYGDDSLTQIHELNVERIRLHSLKNTLNRHIIKSPHYAFSSSLGDKLTQELTLVSIPSIFYGSSIKKGSVDLSINYQGNLLCRVQDVKLNGELLETYGVNSGSVAGVVLYDQGFLLLTGSWGQNVYETVYEYTDGYSTEIIGS